jgi:hypothetical protein
MREVDNPNTNSMYSTTVVQQQESLITTGPQISLKIQRHPITVK